MGIDKEALKRLASQFESGPESGTSVSPDISDSPSAQAGRGTADTLPSHLTVNLVVPSKTDEGSSGATNEPANNEELRQIRQELEEMRRMRDDANGDVVRDLVALTLTESMERRAKEERERNAPPVKPPVHRHPKRIVNRYTSEKRKWPYVAAAGLVLGSVLYWDEITSKAEQWSGSEQSSDESAGQGRVGDAGTSDSGGGFDRSENDDPSAYPPITAPPAPYEEPVITVPQYDPCLAYFANDEEIAPGPDTTVPCRLPAALVYTPSGEIIEPNLQSGEALQVNGTAYLLQEEGENSNFYIIDDEQLVEWSIIPEDTMSGIYTIMMRRLAVDGGYVTDTTFGTYINSGDITDKELFMFLTHNGIVPNYLESIYIKIVGSQKQCLRELAQPSSGFSLGGGCEDLGFDSRGDGE